MHLGDLSDDPLPRPQREMLDILSEFLMTRGHAPTYAELARARGVTVWAVQESLNSLERRRLIRRTPGRARSLEVTAWATPAAPAGGTEGTETACATRGEASGDRGDG